MPNSIFKDRSISSRLKLQNSRITDSYRAIDSHTAGEVTRLLIDTPFLKGRNVVEKSMYFRSHYDHIRKALTLEPRSIPGVLAMLVPPTDAQADYGLIFCDSHGSVDMCVHGTIGVVTCLVELGKSGGEILKSGVTFETPAGLVTARANSKSGKLKSITVSSVPSYFIKKETLTLGKFGDVEVSLAFGGNNFAYVDSKHLSLNVKPLNLRKLLEVAKEILQTIRGNRLAGVSIYEDHDKFARNIMVAENDFFDRSPCGTGTCGRMAILNHELKLNPGQRFVNRSIINSEFVGRIAGQTTVGKHSAIIPEITGSAYLTGVCEFVESESDKLSSGFALA
ncbi:MAG TPA: proline racemase family protein [Nitrososphaerales archaeon]|nr:proline racemase family protein [Nitrososphaerales archaeon]